MKAMLKEEDQKAVEQGHVHLHKTAPSSFIAMGLMLEETQYVYS